MKNGRRIVKTVMLAILCVALLGLTSCKNAEEMGLEGLNKVFYPAFGWFAFLFGWFSPAFWGWIGLAFKANVFVGLVCGLLGAALYVVLMIIGLIIGVLILLAACVVWFILAILNGLFHFTSW